MRARSDAIRTAAFAVSDTLAVVLRKFEFAICAMAWSFVTFIQPAKASIVSWMVRLPVFASSQTHNPDAEWTHFDGGVFGEELDGPKCGDFDT